MAENYYRNKQPHNGPVTFVLENLKDSPRHSRLITRDADVVIAEIG